MHYECLEDTKKKYVELALKMHHTNWIHNENSDGGIEFLLILFFKIDLWKVKAT